MGRPCGHGPGLAKTVGDGLASGVRLRRWRIEGSNSRAVAREAQPPSGSGQRHLRRGRLSSPCPLGVRPWPQRTPFSAEGDESRKDWAHRRTGSYLDRDFSTRSLTRSSLGGSEPSSATTAARTARRRSASEVAGKAAAAADGAGDASGASLDGTVVRGFCGAVGGELLTAEPDSLRLCLSITAHVVEDEESARKVPSWVTRRCLRPAAAPWREKYRLTRVQVASAAIDWHS